MKNLFLVLSMMLVFTVNLHSEIIIHYVKYNATGSNDGTSWTNAYNSFQSALTVAVSGDQIWVASGTYKPTVQVGGTGDRYQTFQMKGGVAIYGGFAGTETDISQRTNFGAGQTNETIFSGDIGIAGDSSDNCYHVFYHPSGWGLTSSAVLDGFTIKGGNASGDGIWQCSYGGGMLNDGNSPSISNCAFTSNLGWSGGGIANYHSSSPTLTNCIFTLNSATVAGGGTFNEQGSGITYTNCTISSNLAHHGGGIENNDAFVTFNNCIIWGNKDTTEGSELYIDGGTTTLNYCCYANATWDNNITSDPQFAGTSINPTYPYSILGTSPCVDAGNDSYNSQVYDIRGAGYSRKLDKTTGGVGTIDMGAYEYKLNVDPLPVELTSFTVSANGAAVTLNWHTATEVNNYGFEIERRTISNQQITQSSIDNWQNIGFVKGAGTSNAPKEYSYSDAIGSTGRYVYRLKQVDNDGAFLYSQSVEVTKRAPEQFALAQNYPNPFNPATSISFNLPTRSFVSLKVFDLMGREVATIVSEEISAGSYSKQWNAVNIPSGIYFYRLQACSFTKTKKLVLLR